MHKRRVIMLFKGDDTDTDYRVMFCVMIAFVVLILFLVHRALIGVAAHRVIVWVGICWTLAAVVHAVLWCRPFVREAFAEHPWLFTRAFYSMSFFLTPCETVTLGLWSVFSTTVVMVLVVWTCVLTNKLLHVHAHQRTPSARSIPSPRQRIVLWWGLLSAVVLLCLAYTTGMHNALRLTSALTTTSSDWVADRRLPGTPDQWKDWNDSPYVSASTPGLLFFRTEVSVPHNRMARFQLKFRQRSCTGFPGDTTGYWLSSQWLEGIRHDPQEWRALFDGRWSDETINQQLQEFGLDQPGRPADLILYDHPNRQVCILRVGVSPFPVVIHRRGRPQDTGPMEPVPSSPVTEPLGSVENVADVAAPEEPSVVVDATEPFAGEVEALWSVTSEDMARNEFFRKWVFSCSAVDYIFCSSATWRNHGGLSIPTVDVRMHDIVDFVKRPWHNQLPDGVTLDAGLYDTCPPGTTPFYWVVIPTRRTA